MIVRRWTARAPAANVDAYVHHFQRSVEPMLRHVDGFRGALVLRRTADEGSADDVEVIVLTRWLSMDAVHAFAGADANVAVVDPAAAAVLTSYDRDVQHYTVIHQID